MKRPIKLVFGLILLLLISCNKEDENVPIVESKVDDTGIMTVLGKKLENPYTIENMQKAYSNLKSSGDISGDIDISVTHKYIRFLPGNEDDMEKLIDDTTLMLFDIPLDYEIIEPGVSYHDPTLPDTSFTWQYCVIEIGQKVPDVYYELIEDLYIPLEVLDENLKNVNQMDYDLLDDEALRITGNLNKLKDASQVERTKWYPSGYIKVWDDNRNNFIPIVGLEVIARSWFTTRKGTTNSIGRFICNGTVKGYVNYSLKWERYHFSIRNGSVGQAKLDGPRLKEKSWNLFISTGHAKFHATIFRAASRYYYEYIYGLKRPPLNGATKPQMKIAAVYKEHDPGARYAHPARVLGIFNTVKIWDPQLRTSTLFSNVIHELGHGAHWNLNSYSYRKADEIVVESWAKGVQYNITKLVYPKFSLQYKRLNYTGVVQDLVDGRPLEKRSSLWWDYSKNETGSPNIKKVYIDNVTGYTMKQIENALNGALTWDEWKDKIKKYNNETSQNVDATFIYWNTK